jgi:hypothetical protein
MNYLLILGKNGHDARFVAAVAIHGLTHLLTFNVLWRCSSLPGRSLRLFSGPV